MPVDLSCIPAQARRRAAPSLKRWLILVIVFIASGGFLTVYLWPADASTHTTLFWLCFLGIPVGGGLGVLSIRWLIYLITEWLADGWDSARARDLAQDIRNGQRSLALLGQVVHLPHVVSAESLSQQLLMPEGIELPAEVEDGDERLVYHACFNETSLPVQERMKDRLRVLLSDTSLQTAFQRLPQNTSLVILLQLSPNISSTLEDLNVLQRLVREMIGFPLNITLLTGDGMPTVDTWLDNPDMMQTLLIIALNFSDKRVDGTGEAAAALLLHSPESSVLLENAIAEIHRPEQTQTSQGLNAALQQALHWGITTPEAIKHVWLTGMGISNEAVSLLSTAGVHFPAAGQPCDIDLKTGLTGTVSPWLAIAAAADQAAQSSSPQLIMCVPNESTLPWFMAVCPVAK